MSELLSAHGSLAGGTLLAAAFLLPIWTPIVPVAMAVAVVTLLWHHRTRLKFVVSTIHEAGLWAMLFYLLHVIGMLWSTNTGFGLFDLNIKLPLLVLPLTICFLPASARVGRNALLFALAIGGAASVVHKLAMAVWRITSDPTLVPAKEVFSSAFSSPFHPSYLALYFCVAIAAWYLTDIHRALPRWGDLLVFTLLCVGTVLCASKAGWLVLMLLLPLMAALRWNTPVRGLLLAFMGASIGLAVLLMTISPYARDRAREFVQAIQEPEHDANATTSSKVRWVTWAAAWDLFREQPLFGTGTGDIKDELLAYYARHDATHALERKLNAHQQFLQSAACLGLFGLVTLIAMFLLPLLAALRARDALAWILPAVLIANLMVESMLEVQAGTCFIAFIMTIITWKGSPRDLRPAGTS